MKRYSLAIIAVALICLVAPGQVALADPTSKSGNSSISGSEKSGSSQTKTGGSSGTQTPKKTLSTPTIKSSPSEPAGKKAPPTITPPPSQIKKTLIGFCCKDGTLTSANKEDCDRKRGTFYTDERKARSVCTGFCCKDGRLQETSKGVCISKVRGEFYTDKRIALKSCRGWCCDEFKVTAASAQQCSASRGKYFGTKPEADRFCSAQKGWCCKDGKITRKSRLECSKKGEQFFTSDIAALQSCKPEKGFCNDDEKTLRLTQTECRKRQGSYFAVQSQAVLDLTKKKQMKRLAAAKEQQIKKQKDNKLTGGTSSKIPPTLTGINKTEQKTKITPVIVKKKTPGLSTSKDIKSKTPKGVPKGTDYGISFIRPVWKQTVRPGRTVVVRYRVTRRLSPDDIIFTAEYKNVTSSDYPWEKSVSIPNDPPLSVGEYGEFEFRFPDDTPLGSYFFKADQGTSTLLGASDDFSVNDYHVKQIHFSSPRTGDSVRSGRNLPLSCWSNERVQTGNVNFTLYTAQGRRSLATTTVRHNPRAGGTEELRVTIDWPIPEGITCDSCYIYAHLSGEEVGEDWRGASGTSNLFSILEPIDTSFLEVVHLPFTPSIQITIDGGTRVRHPGETIRVHVDILPTSDLPLFYHPDVFREGGVGGGLFLTTRNESRGMGVWAGPSRNVISRSADMRRITIDFRLPDHYHYDETEEFVLRYIHQGATARSEVFNIRP